MTVSPARQAYDLILYPSAGDPIGLMITRGKDGQQRGPATLNSRYGPAVDREDPVIRDVPVTQDDFSGGFGHSQRWDYPNVYAWGEGVCTRWPRIVIPAGEFLDNFFNNSGAGTVTTSVVYNADIWFASDNGRIFRSVNGTSAPSLHSTVASWSATSSVVFGGSAYFGGFYGQEMQRITGTTRTALTGITYGHVVKVYSVTADNVGADRLWATDTSSSVRYCSGDPAVAGNWSNSVQIGDSSHPIVQLVATNRHVYAVKPDGLYDLDELGHASNLTPYWRGDEVDLGFSQIGLAYDGYLYVGQGRRGLDRIDLARRAERRDVPDWCQPGYGIPNETPINGYATALTTDQGWLVAAVKNAATGTSYIMYGIDRAKAGIPGPGPILWHGAEAVIPGTGPGANAALVGHLCVAASEAGGQPILWIVYEYLGVTFWGKLSLPKASSPIADVLFGGSHRFNTSATLYTTAQDWNQEYALSKKQIWKYDIRADNLGGGKQIQLSSNDFGGAYSVEGTMISSPRATLGPINTQGYSIGLKAVLTSTATSAAIFRGVRMRAQVLSEQNEYLPYEVEFGEGVPLRNGGTNTDRQDAITIKNALIALQDEPAPFQATDQHGRTFTVRMAQNIEFEEHEASLYGKWRIRARFLLRKMT